MHTWYASSEAEQVKSQIKQKTTTTMGYAQAFPTSLSLACIFFLVVGYFAILHLSISFKNLLNLLRTCHRSKNEVLKLHLPKDSVFNVFFLRKKLCQRRKKTTFLSRKGYLTNL